MIINNRDEQVVKIRPTIPHIMERTSTTTECFQNKTLRPILKMQNELFIVIFKWYIIKRKNVFSTLKKRQQIDYIAQSLKKDLKFKNRLVGVVIGQFTIVELQAFHAEEGELTRRITTMLIERLQSQVDRLV